MKPRKQYEWCNTLAGRVEAALGFRFHVALTVDDLSVIVSCPGCGREIGRFDLQPVMEMDSRDQLQELEEYLAECG